MDYVQGKSNEGGMCWRLLTLTTSRYASMGKIKKIILHEK